MLDAVERPIAIVANDAGAANHIIGWFEQDKRSQVRACLAGPALVRWKEMIEDVELGDLAEVMATCRTLISGTGWASNLEHDARRMARRLGVKSIAVVDHWINYRDRFVRDGEEVLPNEIWVTDEHAKRLAESEWRGVTVVQVPNLYLDNLVRKIQGHTRREKEQQRTHVLYVLEPIRRAWNSSDEPGEFQALDYFVRNMALLGLKGHLSFRLRPHPSDPVGKYSKWIAAHSTLGVSLDGSSLPESIAWSDVVAGCQTYAMVVALAAGRRVISSLPPWAPPCSLPQPGITRLAELTAKSAAVNHSKAP